MRRARGRPTSNSSALHAHVGSQITTLEPLRRAAALRCSAWPPSSRTQGMSLEHLDIGGGLGVSYDGGDGAVGRATTPSALVEAVRDGLSIVLEPGRASSPPPACCSRASSTSSRARDGGCSSSSTPA